MESINQYVGGGIMTSTIDKKFVDAKVKEFLDKGGKITKLPRYMGDPDIKQGIPMGFGKGRASQVSFNYVPQGYKGSSIYNQGEYRTKEVDNYISAMKLQEKKS